MAAISRCHGLSLLTAVQEPSALSIWFVRSWPVQDCAYALFFQVRQAAEVDGWGLRVVDGWRYLFTPVDGGAGLTSTAAAT